MSYATGKSHPDSSVGGFSIWVAFVFMGCVLPKLLVIDNYDSFTYNLVQMFMHYDLFIEVHRNDTISIDQVLKLKPDYILISPGPKDPANAGISIPIIKAFYKKIPIFGVCLGMQCINEAFGGSTVRAPVPMHGKTSIISHDQQDIFRKIPSSFSAARYHSLMVKPDPDRLVVTARSSDGVIMGYLTLCFPFPVFSFTRKVFLRKTVFCLLKTFSSSALYYLQKIVERRK